MKLKKLIAALTFVFSIPLSFSSWAQSSNCPGAASSTTSAGPVVSEDFTGTTTNSKWNFFNGACLTAGMLTDTTTQPNYVPGCVSVLSSYYQHAANGDQLLLGGESGFLGSATAPSSISGQKPDDNCKGALRFTNGMTSTYKYGYHENGAIVSATGFPTNQGVTITFKTVTYEGDSGGNGATGAAHSTDGADGISFFLMDASFPAGIGAWGGSLGYSCSNSNIPYDGLVGGYLGLGIDEFGNFLNGTANTLGVTSPQSLGDNTATGGGVYANRIGLRGAGSVSWAYLNSKYKTNPSSNSKPYYPSAMTTVCPMGTYDSTLNYCTNYCSNAVSGKGCPTCSKGTWNGSKTSPSCNNGGSFSWTNPTGPTYSQQAIQNTCKTGTYWNYANYTSGGGVDTKVAVADYAALPNPALLSQTIANESATTRAQATPIVYNLKITQNGLLTLSYSYNGGATSTPITNYDITNNGTNPMPANFRFGFAGSTGGATNIHEILCFKASPTTATGTSGSVNVYEDPTIKTGTQQFLAYYFPQNWTGSLTAQTIGFDTSKNTVAITTIPNWDARCVLTGVDATTGPCSTGVASQTAEVASSRTMLTWGGSSGIPFEWKSLSTTQQGVLTAGDPTPHNSDRLLYLRGDRTNELSSSQSCPQLVSNNQPCYRVRESVLGDIVDSSPTWVGPPLEPYTLTSAWVDQLNPTTTLGNENQTGAQKYSDFMSAEQTRLNVVYVGANDGFLHGFRAGSQDAQGNLVVNTAAPNDGNEVLAYMPQAVFNSIHPVDPTSKAVIQASDYSDPQYSHAWYVDSSPATGDVFYASGSTCASGQNGCWHTWLVGGLGYGGAGFYALDVTNPTATGSNPTTTNFAEGNAAKIVIGDWTPATLTCSNDAKGSTCGPNLGQVMDTPLMRRFHNGQWGVIFGNGLKSSTNATGIYIMLIDPNSGTPSFLYLPTKLATGGTTANGIASVASADYDLDHVVDYIYAGDLLGNVWKWDVTSQTTSNWGVTTSSPLFTAGQPITTRITVSTVKTITTYLDAVGLFLDNSPQRVILAFGTGAQLSPQTATNGATYQTGQQYMYGIWDWDQGTPGVAGSGWNALSPKQQNLGVYPGPQAISQATNLQVQTLTRSGTTGKMSQNVVCFSDLGTCSGTTATNQMGWYLPLPTTNEQVIFNPIVSNVDGSLIVNTFVPSTSSLLDCNQLPSTGFSIGLEAQTGAGLAIPLFNVGGVSYDSVERDATGSAAVINSGQAADNNASYLLTHNANGSQVTQLNDTSITTGQRLYWIQKR